MPDNVSKMTLEEKLVQKIKGDSLMSLIGDEDAMLILVKRALHEALYQPIRKHSPSGYNTRTEDSPVVAATRQAADTACATIAGRIVKEIMSDETIRKEINNAIGVMLPSVILGWLETGLSTHLEKSSADAQIQLREALAAQNIHLNL